MSLRVLVAGIAEQMAERRNSIGDSSFHCALKLERAAVKEVFEVGTLMHKPR